MSKLTGEYSYACDNHARADARCHNCRLLLRYYQAGISEGEARATRAIVADLRARLAFTGMQPAGNSRLKPGLEWAADRYEAGHHLAAKAEAPDVCEYCNTVNPGRTMDRGFARCGKCGEPGQ